MPRRLVAIALLAGLVPMLASLTTLARSASAADCPSSTMDFGSAQRSTSAATDDTLFYVNGESGQVGGYFDLGLDTLRASSSSSYPYTFANVVMRDRYELLGAPAGTPITFTIRMPMLGHASVYPGSPQGLAYLDAAIIVDGVTVDSLHNGSYCCHTDVSEQLSVQVTEPAGQQFEIAQRLVSTTGANSSFFAIGAGLHVEDLPPGVTLASCHGLGGVFTGVAPPRPASGLRLEAVWPNPASRLVRVAFSVPRGAPALLSLVDVSGRVVDSRVIDAGAGGTHAATLGERAALAPGAYFVRLAQGGLSSARRVTIVR